MCMCMGMPMACAWPGAWAGASASSHKHAVADTSACLSDPFNSSLLPHLFHIDYMLHSCALQE